MNIKKYFFGLLIATLNFTILCQTVWSAGQNPSSGFKILLESKTLRVGVAYFTPWAFKDKNGELAGFEIDVATKLAEDMNLTPKFYPKDWDKLIPALLDGEIDIIIAGMAITPQRALKVNFSQPYATAGINIATNLSLTEDIHGLEELNREKINIGVVAETVSEEFVEHLFEKATIIKYKTSQEAKDKLVAAKIHAYMESKPIPQFLALKHPRKIDVPVSEPLFITKAGFAIKKGDSDFLNFLNSWIIARESDTWIKSNHDYWFKSLKWRKKYLP